MRGMNPAALQSMFQAVHSGKGGMGYDQAGKLKKKQPMMLHSDPSILGTLACLSIFIQSYLKQFLCCIRCCQSIIDTIIGALCRTKITDCSPSVMLCTICMHPLHGSPYLVIEGVFLPHIVYGLNPWTGC